VLISVFSGAAFAFLLYSKKHPWKDSTNILLAVFRLLSVALLIFMVLSPFIKSDKTISEKSKIVIAIDNSSSVNDALGKNTDELKNNIQMLTEQLGERFEIKTFDLDGSFTLPVSQLNFNKNESDIANMLNQVSSSLEASDVKALLLITDGIANKGTSPLFSNFNYPIYSVGIGDTTVPKDILVKNCLFNNIVGKNNRFPISVEIKAHGYKGERVSISIYSGRKKILSDNIYVDKNEFTGVVAFENTEKEAGIRHYKIVAETLKGEYTIKNNQKDIYFEVIEVVQKIALMASAPHPDVKALAASLDGNENIEVDICVENSNDFTAKKYDLAIAYQLPNVNSSFNTYLATFIANNTPILFVLGTNSNLNDLNKLLPNFKIIAQQGQFDKVTGIANAAFTRLSFNSYLNQFLDKTPPLIVPFGAYNLGNGWQTVLNQKVGIIETEKPLFALYASEGTQYGVIFGEGLWQWRINEYAENANTIVFDDFIKKTTTLLAQKTDKRKFRCNTSEKIYDENTTVLFKIETYNDIYEPIFEKEINFNIKNEKGKVLNYKFTNTALVPNFDLNGLTPGAYSFLCKTVLSGKEETAKGEFIIRNTTLEDITQVADFELLRNIAAQSKGKFYQETGFDKVYADLQTIDATKKIYKIDSISEIISFSIILFLIIIMFTLEWGLRKYLGQD